MKVKNYAALVLALLVAMIILVAVGLMSLDGVWRFTLFNIIAAMTAEAVAGISNGRIYNWIVRTAGWILALWGAWVIFWGFAAGGILETIGILMIAAGGLLALAAAQNKARTLTE